MGETKCWRCMHVPIASQPSSSTERTICIDYQRQRAKEMSNHFNRIKRDKNFQDAKLLGLTPKNEIINGRWVMMGLAIGLLTEYSTGVDFIDQLKLTVSYLGIADIADPS